MKSQFAVLTLLVCFTVLAVVTALCIFAPVAYDEQIRIGDKPNGFRYESRTYARSPRISETAIRIAWFWPLALATTIAVMWCARKLLPRVERMTNTKFRPRFGLRTLAVLVTLAAISMGWVAYQLNWIRQRQAALRWIESLHGHYIDASLPYFLMGADKYDGKNAPWSIGLFGAQSIYSIQVGVPSDSVAQHEQELRELFPEANSIAIRANE